MNEPLSTDIELIRQHHPDATAAAIAMMDAAVLHQRIAELEGERDELRSKLKECEDAYAQTAQHKWEIPKR